jgi:outer membrane protein, multidrug efflux system
MRRLFPLLVLLTACNLAPRYQQPQLCDMPCGWRVSSDDSSTLCNLRWWEALNDPVLNELILTALANNRDLQVAVWRVKEYWGQYEVVRASLMPQITASGSALKERLPLNANITHFIPGLDPVITDYQALFNLSYEFDFWGRLRNQMFDAYSQYLAQEADRQTVIMTLVSSVAQSYVRLRQLDMELQIAKATLESRDESYRIACARFQGGLTSQIDVMQALSAYEESVAAVEELERQIPQQENLLSVLLGESPHDIVRGKEIYELQLPPALPTGLPSDLLTRRPDIRAAEHRLIGANANIGAARAAFLPQFNLFGFTGRESFLLRSLFTTPSRTWDIGGSFLQPIFMGGSLIGNLHITKAQKQELLYSYEQAILTALREVNSSLIGYQQSQQIFAAYTADVTALQQYLRLSWLRYYEGQTQYLTVLDAERTLFSAQIKLVQAQADQFLTLIDLYKALGGGWVIDADTLVCEPEY